MKVLAKIKQHPEMKKIPVIMQTGAASSEQITEGIEAGVFHYLVKPFRPDSLISLVKVALPEKFKVAGQED